MFNQRALDKLESRLDARISVLASRMDGRLNIIEARLDRMQSDLSMFYKILGEHGADIENLKKNKTS